MPDYSIEKRIGDLVVRAYGIEPSSHTHLTSFSIAFAGESERLELSGPRTIEGVRDLHYAIGAILAEADRKMKT